MSSNATEGARETGAQAGGPDPEATADVAAQAPAQDAAPPGASAPGPENGAPGPEDGSPPRGDGSPPGSPGDEYFVGETPYRRPKVSKLAVVALVAGILSLVPVAVVTGIAALIGIRRSGRRGHGMAVTALFLAAAWLIVGGAVGTVAVVTHGFHKPVKTVYHQAAVFRLQPGQCIDIPNGSPPTVVSCTVPHDAEVFGTFRLPGSGWPGTAAVQQEASDGCGTRLATYLNPQLATSLTQAYVYPVQVDWNAGTRTVICEVRAESGQLTQSVRAGSSPGATPSPGSSAGS